MEDIWEETDFEETFSEKVFKIVLGQGWEVRRVEMLGVEVLTIERVGLEGIPPKAPKHVIMTLTGGLPSFFLLLLIYCSNVVFLGITPLERSSSKSISSTEGVRFNLKKGNSSDATIGGRKFPIIT